MINSTDLYKTRELTFLKDKELNQNILGVMSKVFVYTNGYLDKIDSKHIYFFKSTGEVIQLPIEDIKEISHTNFDLLDVETVRNLEEYGRLIKEEQNILEDKLEVILKMKKELKKISLDSNSITNKLSTIETNFIVKDKVSKILDELNFTKENSFAVTINPTEMKIEVLFNNILTNNLINGQFDFLTYEIYTPFSAGINIEKGTEKYHNALDKYAAPYDKAKLLLLEKIHNYNLDISVNIEIEESEITIIEEGLSHYLCLSFEVFEIKENSISSVEIEEITKIIEDYLKILNTFIKKQA